jgi:chemotaxis signal transduction protein
MTAASPAAEGKAILFTAGGVRLALRLSQIREIVSVEEGAPEVVVRGEPIPALPVAVALGLPARPSRFALVTESSPATALKVDSVHGIVDLSTTEVFQLPARTLLPQPPPFQGALVRGGDVALELAVSSLGWVPIEPALDRDGPPPELDFPVGRELLFTRAGRTYAVPLQLLARVLDAPRVFPVPLAPAAHRGVLYHERAIHPVFDLAVLFGRGDAAGEGTALLVDAGGTTIAVLADRILHAGEVAGPDVARPGWDLMFT